MGVAVESMIPFDYCASNETFLLTILAGKHRVRCFIHSPVVTIYAQQMLRLCSMSILHPQQFTF